MSDRIIDVNFKGIDKVIDRATKIKQAVQHPNIHKMVQGMAGVWQSNFDSEGGAVGGWRPLTEMTQRVRMQRGYPPQHPILVQSGALKRAAVTGLTNVNGPRVLTYKDVMMSYVPHDLGATLTISGAKVDNQFRIRTADFSQPARPFWFVNGEVEDAALGALHEWISRELG